MSIVQHPITLIIGADYALGVSGENLVPYNLTCHAGTHNLSLVYINSTRIVCYVPSTTEAADYTISVSNDGMHIARAGPLQIIGIPHSLFVCLPWFLTFMYACVGFDAMTPVSVPAHQATVIRISGRNLRAWTNMTCVLSGPRTGGIVALAADYSGGNVTCALTEHFPADAPYSLSFVIDSAVYPLGSIALRGMWPPFAIC